MSNSYKRYVLSISLSYLIIPNLVFASWWNPFSWFEKKQNTEQIKQEKSGKVISSNEKQVDGDKLIPQEKIIEKTITVNNPELQKQINELIRENIDLKNKVSSLTSSLNMYKETNKSNQATLNTEYSDFDFKFILSTNKITFPFSTSRDIVIKKAVFNIKDSHPNDTRKIGFVQRLEVSTSTDLKPIYYNLENRGSKFTFLGTGIPLKGKETMVVNVSIANSSNKETDTFFMIPIFSEWEVWDNTTNKPVVVE